MGGINLGRWLAGGITAGIVIWILEGAASIFYMADMQAAMEAHGLVMEMNASAWVISVTVSLLVGLTLIFFYAASRPRFGPGPGTAVLVAFVPWMGAYVVSLLGYLMLVPHGHAGGLGSARAGRAGAGGDRRGLDVP